MFKDFVDNYLLENCEGETFEVVGLTDFNVGGAGKSGKEVYFSQYTTCMAFLQEEVIVDEGRGQKHRLGGAPVAKTPFARAVACDKAALTVGLQIIEVAEHLRI